ncbi:ATPase, AAA family domain containing protein [Theileria equi strain WA]|uniref:ATPase, AAA family domain containing protein n=1 Tax=Theileria equi strain WA TaxID=1537102 RepID=L0AWB5_THEEQ|nr:ATPase, AAA family domain containing protein [Theileria equi strain WA]AFZ79321.1 ATPase, AAA family domain containing protein [Theileria equi strain WA]|eukprot:XP_004828987.1 ATPase, AAA family domain containing protein [Theileria equi strain WA]
MNLPFSVIRSCFLRDINKNYSEIYCRLFTLNRPHRYALFLRGFGHTSVLNNVEYKLLHYFISDNRYFSSSKVPKGFGKFTKGGVTPDPKSTETEGSSQAKNESKDDENGRSKPEGDSGPNDNDPKSKYNLVLEPWSLFIIGMTSVLLLELMDTRNLRNEITMQEFISKYFMKGYVTRIQVVNKEFCRCYISQIPPLVLPKYVTFRIGSVDSFEQKINDIQASMGLHPQDYIPIRYVNETNFLSEVKKSLPYLFFTILLVTGLRKISIKGAGGMDRIFKIGRATPMDVKDLKVKVKFKDVAGMHEAKKEISEFVDFLRNPQRYESFGAKIPKGVLLCGDPGTGKTLLAKAVAGEANVPFYSMSGSDFIEVFVGVGPSRVRDLFEKARKNAPAIIFIDEIDAVGKKRSKGGFSGGANDERENTLNQLLVEMDGFKTTTGVIVLAGTNRADILDPALTRPGRFDRTVNISKPDLDERYEIFKVHLKPLKFNPSLDVDEVARRLASLTPNFVGAEIANVSNEAAIQAARRRSENGVCMIDFDNAIERVMAGMKRPPGLLTPQQKLVVAYHEVGHALVGWWLEHADPVLKVSIIPRSSGALGFAQQLPDDSMLFSREALLDKIAVILGGRAAEDIFIGKITTGATDDLNKVTKMCYAFVSKWGMNSKLGLVSFQRDSGEDPNFYRSYSETTAQIIDKEVRSMIEMQYKRVKDMLSGKAELVHKLSQLLYDKETITYKDIANCVGEREFPIKDKHKPYIDVRLLEDEPTTLLGEPTGNVDANEPGIA